MASRVDAKAAWSAIVAVAIKIPLVPPDIAAIVPDVAHEGIEGLLIAMQIVRDAFGGVSIAIAARLLQLVLIPTQMKQLLAR